MGNFNLKDTKPGDRKAGRQGEGKDIPFALCAAEPSAEKNQAEVISESVVLSWESPTNLPCYMQVLGSVSLAFGALRDCPGGEQNEAVQLGRCP